MRWHTATGCLFVIAIITTVHAQTPEEREIRQTYARVTLASEISAVYSAVFDKKDFAKELENDRVEFRLSDFRVGNVADHLDEPLKNFFSKANGEEWLQITPGTQGFQREVNGERFGYQEVHATIRWAGHQPIGRPEWDTVSLGLARNIAIAHDGENLTRFASFLVQTTFRGKTQTTRAVWWYGTDKAGKPIVATVDNLNNGAGSFRTKQLYPAILLDDPETRKNPIVVQWLKSMAQDCPGNKQENCYDESTGKAGISRQDIERGPMPPEPSAAPKVQ